MMTVKTPVQQITTLRLPAQLAAGMYLLYLETDKGTVARKVVVE